MAVVTSADAQKHLVYLLELLREHREEWVSLANVVIVCIKYILGARWSTASVHASL